MKKIFFIICIIYMFTFCTYNVYAFDEEHKLNFKNITIEEGLSHSKVTTIFQDSYGYMWFGTYDGLNRYDGHSFDIYKYNETKKSISSNNIVDIFEDNNGYIWIATPRGINKITKNGEKIEEYNNYNGLSHYNVLDIMKDSRDNIWVGTENGLNVINNGTKKIYKFLNAGDGENQLSNNFITTICEDKNGDIWVGTKKGLNIFSIKDNKIKIYKKGGLDTKYISKLYSSDNHVYIGTLEDGLFEIDLKDDNIKSYNDDILKSNITSILQDNSGKLWIGTDKGLIKKDNDKLEIYNNEFYDEQSLIDDNILSINQDNSGLIWVGTDRGISMFNPNRLFNHYKKNPLNKNTFSDNSFTGIYEDNEGLLWIGTTDNGINILDRKNNDINVLKKSNEKNSISDNEIFQITGKDDLIWIGTGNGLSRYNKNTKEFKNYYSNNSENSLLNNEVRSLFVDKSGLLWIGTRDGLCTIDDDGIFKNYNYIFEENNIIDKFITCIYEDNYGNMWFGTATNGGLIKYDKKTQKVKNYLHSRGNDNTLSFNSIKAITGDSLGNLWIATNYGVNKFNIEKEIFTIYNEKNGLYNNLAHGILIDDNNNPWISTNNGIYKLDIKKNVFTSFDITDGLQNKQFNDYSYYKSKNGEMFFGGISGLNIFIPSKVKKISYVSNVKIKSIMVNNRNIDINKDIELRHDENYLNIEFFLPEFRNTSKTNYYYMMNGLEKEWKHLGNNNFVTYANIPSGDYKFLVVARNSNGDVTTPTEVNIEIMNPPWKSKFAYLIYVVIGIGVIYLIWNYVNILENIISERTKRLNIKLNENEQLYKKVIENEKYKNNYFVNLSHELRTPLNVMLSSVQLIDRFNKSEEGISRDKLDNYTIMLKRNSKRLLKLINNIIDTAKIEAGEYRLNMEKVNIIYLVEDLVLSMSGLIEENGIELVIDPEIEELYVECDVNAIERCIVNLIGNAVKFTNSGGKIEVKMWYNEKLAYISIEDTGIGIEEKYHKTIFNRFSQTYTQSTEEHGGSGLGLTLTKQLIELHGGKIKLESTLGKGSIFILILPIEKQH